MTRSTVTVDTGTVDLTTDVGEEVGVVALVDGVAGNTGQGVDHALTHQGVWGRWQDGGGSPVGTHSRTSSDGSGGGRGRGKGSIAWADLGELTLQVGEVGQGGDLAVVDGDQTVVVALLEVHVDDTTGPNASHLGRVDGLDFTESSRSDGVTTVLGEENGDTQVLVGGGDLRVTGGLEGRSTAPLVHVNTEEVSSLGSIATGEVVGQVNSDVSVVVGGVTDRDASVTLLQNVRLGVSDGSLHVSRGVGVVDHIGDLVTGKETQHVGVVVEGIDDRGVSVQQVKVPGRSVSVDGELWLRQVGNHVDTGVSQGLHTLGVVLGHVQGVHTNHVSLQLLQIRNVSRACFPVRQWVNKRQGRRRRRRTSVLLVGHTFHQKLRAIVRVVKLVTHNLNRRKAGGGNRGDKR